MDARRITELMGTMGGHAGLDFGTLATATQEDQARQHEELLAEAHTLAAPFLTPAGQACLEALVKKTVLRPLLPMLAGQTPEQLALHAAQREGQNQIVAILMQALAMVNGAEALPDRGQ